MSDAGTQVRIVTDSAADIPRDVAASLGITVVPLLVRIGGKTYRDGVDLSGEEFYERLARERSVTTTSLPTLASLEDAYRCLTSDGHEVVSIHLSSRLSGAYNAALIASSADGVPSEKISVVDTLTVTMAQGLVAIRAAEAAREGKTRGEIEALANEVSPLAHIFGLLDTLEFAMKSGRLGRLPGTVGTLINIKPILTMKATGEAIVLERVRARGRGMARLVELAASLRPLERLAVIHADDEQGALELREMLKPLNAPEPVLIAHIGAVLGTHIGPRGVGVCCLRRRTTA